jgi:AcrR family transcriptional regulator
MDGDVKTHRPNERAVPQARTRRTRTAVIDAARTLFLERGYAATTIEAMSDLSDTPQPTVYRLFASKLGILKALLDVAIVGDDEATLRTRRSLGSTVTLSSPPRSKTATSRAMTERSLESSAASSLIDDASRRLTWARIATCVIRSPVSQSSAS